MPPIIRRKAMPHTTPITMYTQFSMPFVYPDPVPLVVFVSPPIIVGLYVELTMSYLNVTVGVSRLP